VRRTLGLAGSRAHAVVLAVGAGLGSLPLAPREALLAPGGTPPPSPPDPPEVGQVVAVEIDPVLAAELPRTVAARAPELAGRLSVVAADALHVGERDLPAAPAGPGADLPYKRAGPGGADPLAPPP